jgi:ribosomal subunit interface protein
MTTPNTIPWNFVTKNLQGSELLHKKLQEKITKLEKHLIHFPSDAVHLQVVLERHPKKPLHTAALTLRVPSNILHSEKSSPDVISAFDNAVKALLRELQSLKADLRRERFWKGKERRKQLRQLKTTGFAAEPMAEGSGPQRFEDVIRELLQEHYAELLRHVRRHIRHDEMAGDIPKGALDARDIVDEAARQALTQASRKPHKMNWLVWFYFLIHPELRRQRRALKQAKAEVVSLEELKVLPDDAEKASGYDAERPLDIIEQELEPPDEIAAEKDLLEHLQTAVQSWPRAEREIFELYFIEGFDPDEIAMVTRQTLKTVQENISSIQNRLREGVLEQALI